MPDPFTTLTLAITALAAIALIAVTSLKGFTGWLDLKRAELAAGSAVGPAPVSSRIDIADLKERIRKLEAIAAGVDL